MLRRCNKDGWNNKDSWRNNPSCYNIGVLLIAFCCYLINKELKTVTDNIIVQGYFNDFLAMILLLPYSNLLLKKKNWGIYTLKGICIYTTITSIVWEVLTPMVKPSSVGDIKDVVAYFLGSFLYYATYKVIVIRRLNGKVYNVRL